MAAGERAVEIHLADEEPDRVRDAGRRFIREDFSHQQTIYECLNSHELRRLFESIHDENWELRTTAVRFIAHLLFGNRPIIELVSAMQGYDCPPEHKRVTPLRRSL